MKLTNIRNVTLSILILSLAGCSRFYDIGDFEEKYNAVCEPTGFFVVDTRGNGYKDLSRVYKCVDEDEYSTQ